MNPISSTLIILLACSAFAGLNAQITESIVAPESPRADVDESDDDTDTPATGTPNPELIGTPSRYGLANLADYIATLHTVLAMKDQKRGPFGRLQDPEKVNTEDDLLAKLVAQEQQVVKKTPFKDIISAIPITGIIPEKKKFLIGGVSYNLGDSLNLRTKGNKIIQVTATEINANSITFKHRENDETAIKKVVSLPPGLQPGSKQIQPEGLEKEGSDEPIDLNLGG